MKDQFVTYEIAKALKELGFNEPCFATYLRDKDGWDLIIGPFNEYNPEFILFVPLWQQAIDWIRETSKINIVVTNQGFNNGDGLFYQYQLTPTGLHKNLWLCTGIKKYSEAREAAILKAIELIKNK
jgi:hypothetical protein